MLPEGTRLQRGHPCTTPAELVRRCLYLVPRPKDGRRLLVADSYAGSGTTGVVAQWMGMDYALAAHSPEYVALMRERLDSAAQRSRMEVA